MYVKKDSNDLYNIRKISEALQQVEYIDFKLTLS